jgi:hypothetical protein
MGAYVIVGVSDPFGGNSAPCSSFGLPWGTKAPFGSESRKIQGGLLPVG